PPLAAEHGCHGHTRGQDLLGTRRDAKSLELAGHVLRGPARVVREEQDPGSPATDLRKGLHGAGHRTVAPVHDAIQVDEQRVVAIYQRAHHKAAPCARAFISGCARAPPGTPSLRAAWRWRASDGRWPSTAVRFWRRTGPARSARSRSPGRSGRPWRTLAGPMRPCRTGTGPSRGSLGSIPSPAPAASPARGAWPPGADGRSSGTPWRVRRGRTRGWVRRHRHRSRWRSIPYKGHVPEVRPFTGLLYDPSVVGPVGAVTAPPYDTISPIDQERYHRAHPHNVVRLILGRAEPGDDEADNPYVRAASYLRRWRRDGALVPTEGPAVFPYEFRFHLGGVERLVRGVIAEVGLEPWGGSILRHERTLAGPVEDRLRLLRAVRANLSPVYAVLEGPSRGLIAFLDREMSAPPILEVHDEAGTRHRMWVGIPGA